jgi:diguanylate cyclase (GGDEF)-like protein
MVTGRDDTGSIDRAYAAGATDFATKPLNQSLLPYRLRYMLRAGNAFTDLTIAQRIARMGNWQWHIKSDTFAWSDQIYEILGLDLQAVPPTRESLLQRVHEDDRNHVTACLLDVAKNGQPASTIHRIVLPDQSQRHVQQQIEAVLDNTGKVTRVVATLQDITERRLSEEKIRQLAYYDSLTALPNRESFKERLDNAIAHAKRHQRNLAVLFLDLDDFKRINDTLGHTVGDMLLQAVGERLLTSVRASDSVNVARLGGDEFTILLSEVHAADDAARVARRIIGTLTEPLNLAGHEAYITPSIGITLFPQDGENTETLLKHADLAMYAAKRSGKNLFQFFDASLNDAALERLTLDNLLRKALARNELFVHYQPQMDLVDGRIKGVEVLLRWRSPELGMISPAEFIPLAEENGQIVPIGEWVLRTACAQIKAWQDEGFALSRMAVNISVVQFVRPEFPDLVAQILQDTGVEPGVLELEITESLLAKDVDTAVTTLHALKDIGVQLSIDDFGTGYSSLSQLKRFPIDRLKIDRSFVRDITTDPDDAAIAKAVIGMASNMNLSVCAEGVETEAQMRYLASEQCDEMQGYYLSRPVPADELGSLLKEHQTISWDMAEAGGGRRTLLLVDDDPATLTALARLVSAEGYEVLTTVNAREALDLLAVHDIGVIVADYRMPDMDGNELLKRARSLYPHTARIMLSGHSDMKSLIKAVNAGAIHTFLEKPVSAPVLRKTLSDAFLVHQRAVIKDDRELKTA